MNRSRTLAYFVIMLPRRRLVASSSFHTLDHRRGAVLDSLGDVLYEMAVGVVLASTYAGPALLAAVPGGAYTTALFGRPRR